MNMIKKKYVIGKKATILLSSEINWDREYERMLLEEIESEKAWNEIVSHSLGDIDKNGYAKTKKRSDIKAKDRSYTDGSMVFSGYDFFIEYMPCKGDSLQLYSDKVPIER